MATPSTYTMSPNVDVFSTPPQTPTGLGSDTEIRTALSRRNSRPSSLRIDYSQTEWNADIIVEGQSPEFLKAKGAPVNGNGSGMPPVDRDQTIRAQPAPSISQQLTTLSLIHDHSHPSMKSPCFVHSHLDKGASLSDWLRAKQRQALGDVGVAKALQNQDEHNQLRVGTNGHTIGLPVASPPPSVEEDDEFRGSLTKQLADTAVGVREMSKELGRARIHSNIQNVLVVTKARDNRLIQLTRELALYLMLKPRNGTRRGLVVYVDNQLRHSRRFDAAGIEHDHPDLFIPVPRRRSSSNNSLSSMSSSSTNRDEFSIKEEGQLRYWTSDMCSRSPHLFDFVITLGGDGTVLFTSWLFQRIVPPVLPFALGSLGFLTNFDFADHQVVMDSAIDSGIRVNLRMRFTCTVYRAVADEKGRRRKAVKKGETGEIMMKNVEKGGWEALEGGWSGGYNMPEKCSKDKEIMCFTTRPVETFEVLNDLVVDRGPSPYVSLLELFGDEHHMTTVQADGLTVSTPTGSTAYSLSAGGSLVHPEIPSILITPICPHTLSFRPMLLPDSMELRICVPFNSRSTAWASFDGRGRVELKQGDHIKVTASKYPFPTVCADKQSTDWFHAISRTLKWNERERQKSFVVVEEGPAKKKKKQVTPDTREREHKSVEEVIEDEEDEVSDDDDEEDKFDIDDSSPEAAAKESSSFSDSERSESSVARNKAREEAPPTPEAAAAALSVGNPFLRARRKSRSRSRSSGLRSGVDTPDRFAGPHPHPPRLSPRHVEFADLHHGDSDDSYETLSDLAAQRGLRDDDIHAARVFSSARSRIPKDRDGDGESLKTPTVGELVHGALKGHNKAHPKDYSPHPHRAFAVWGQDESDSNASDSDA